MKKKVKRLTMSFMRATEESRPLVHTVLKTPKKNGWNSLINDESNYDTDKMVSSKFGESCRKSLTPVLDNRRKDTYGFKKKYFLRETSSGKNPSDELYIYLNVFFS